MSKLAPHRARLFELRILRESKERRAKAAKLDTIETHTDERAYLKGRKTIESYDPADWPYPDDEDAQKE